MSTVSAATSMLMMQQVDARQQAMVSVAVKQDAQQGQAIADMLQSAVQSSPGATPPGQGQSVDIRV